MKAWCSVCKCKCCNIAAETVALGVHVAADTFAQLKAMVAVEQHSTTAAFCRFRNLGDGQQFTPPRLIATLAGDIDFA